MGLLSARVRFCRPRQPSPSQPCTRSVYIATRLKEHSSNAIYTYPMTDVMGSLCGRIARIRCPPIRTPHHETYQVVYLKQQRYNNTGHRQNVFTRIANPQSSNAAAGH